MEETDGAPGVFKVKIKQNGTSAEHGIGAIVSAAGWVPYDPEKLDNKLCYGKSPNVITNAQFEDNMSGDQVNRPSDGKAVKKRGLSPVCRSA